MGHLARSPGFFDLDRAISTLTAALKDPSERVRESAEWAAADLLIYRGEKVASCRPPRPADRENLARIWSRIREEGS